MMRLTPQSSLESTGAGGDNTVVTAAPQQQQPMLLNQNIQHTQQVYTPQQISGAQGQVGLNKEEKKR